MTDGKPSRTARMVLTSSLEFSVQLGSDFTHPSCDFATTFFPIY
jgi:hypothetical protein